MKHLPLPRSVSPDHDEPAATKLDRAIAGGTAVLCMLLSVILLPQSQHLRALASELLLIWCVVASANDSGRDTVSGWSVMWVTVGGLVVLILPALPSVVRDDASMPLVVFGAQAAAMLWAALRWQPRPPKAQVSLGKAWAYGLLMAAGLGAIATIPIGLALVSRSEDAVEYLWVYPAYAAGALGAATVYWILQRIAHLATGLYLLGTLAGTCVYVAIAPVVMLTRGEPSDPLAILAMGSFLGGLVGPAVAFNWAEEGL